jgi:hypothetical protein
MMNAMGATCTYIPFLIRWDLLPPWKKSGKDFKIFLFIEMSFIKNPKSLFEIKFF